MIQHFIRSIIVLVLLFSESLAADGQKPARGQDAGEKDLQVIEVLDILELMSLVEHMELLQDINIIVDEGKGDEKSN